MTIGPDGVAYLSDFYGTLLALKVDDSASKSSWPMFGADPQHTGRVHVSPQKP